jgi:ketosteroid isomerase-like protein
MRCLFLSAVTLVLCVGATPADAPAQPLVQSADERAIRALEERERAAVLAEDRAALERIWSERFVVNNPQNAVSPDRAAVLSAVERGQIRYSRFERRIEALRFEGEVAIVMGGETIVRAAPAGTPATAVERRFTHVWRRVESEWQLIGRHANVIAPQ